MADPNSPVTRFQVWRASLPPALRLLLTINVVAYLAFVLLSIVNLGGVMAEWLALAADPSVVLTRPWTLLTYSFANLYVGFFGLISFAFAMAWLNWIGRDLEWEHGSHQLFGLYVLAILGGAALAVGLGGGGFGAWGAVGAVVVAAAVLHPDRGIGLMFIGVISLKWVAIVFVVLDLAFSRDLTHVGAYLVALAFGLAARRGIELGAWAKPLFRGAASRPQPVPSFGGAGGGFGGRFRGRGEDDEGEAWKKKTAGRAAPARASRKKAAPAKPTQADVDRILEKIHASGVDSLSKDERRVLESWSGRG